MLRRGSPTLENDEPALTSRGTPQNSVLDHHTGTADSSASGFANHRETREKGFHVDSSRYVFEDVYNTGELFLGKGANRGAGGRNSRKHEFGHERRSIRATNTLNWEFVVEGMWIISECDNIPRLRTGIKQ
ncbi:unnamed protein product [Angiostrongylus costaricensis]|uniref:TLDc domain-containing protein n=1 Tax=Angiostrongylus costaricensis TaxID=334426 RepID=A0A0R3PDR4_ANGCS|nr:unnamed protein product [Angiostrongylus costaricensis]